LSVSRSFTATTPVLQYFGGYFRVFSKNDRIYPAETELRTPYRVRNLAPFWMLLAIDASP
jgi:hypothetical protein